ncbi:phosducin-like protein 3 [Iris pallida]|uniref:Phosducin-like protein 3 n=1 Tax=Iris pallida TaxID=29817 RepID=A0AAX6F7M3_IRIPA|nr:phosducin-like protein 3 [Iris pallida]
MIQAPVSSHSMEDLPYSSQENIEKLDLIDEDESGSGGLVVIQIWGKIFIS